MKDIFKKLAFLSACSLLVLTGCHEEYGELLTLDPFKSDDSNEEHDSFTDYERLERITGYQNLLKGSSYDSGMCFDSYSTLVNYVNEVNNLNGELDGFVSKLSEEDFVNNKLVFTSQVALTAGNIDVEFNRMYLSDNNLYVSLELKSYGDAGIAVMRYAVFTFFVSKTLVLDNVITLVNNQRGIGYTK